MILDRSRDGPDGAGHDDTVRAGAGVVVLDGCSGDADLLGGKGAALDRLVALGLAVPPTGVVTTNAYRAVARADSVVALLGRIDKGDSPRSDEVDRAFLAATIPSRLLDQLLDVAATVGGGTTVAVRSSATVEDLAGSSFAGQYRSILDVDPDNPGAIEDAVKLVFGSLWHPAPRVYRTAFGIDPVGAAMAVVVMRMVPAVRAGVVFTIDPARSPGQARIEAVEGLGESLVSGQRTPEAHVVPRRRPRPGTPDEIVAALDAALVVEAAAGAPQDVEWVFDGDRVWIVQARPITVSDERGDGFDSEQDDHELTTAGIGEMLPGVLSPMAWDLNGTFVNEAFRHLVAGLGAGGAELEAPFVRRVSGRAALDFTRLRELAVALPGGSAEELELQYFGSRRPGRPAAEPAPSAWWRSLLHDLRAGALLRRANLDAEICVEAVADLADDLPNLDRFDAAALLSYRNRLCDLALRAATAEMAVAAAATSAYRKIELLLMPHLGAADAGRFAERATMGRGVAVVPQRDSSAALFGGPTWRQLGREPVVPIPSEGASRAWNELLRALDATSSWGGDGLRDVIRTRALRRIVDDTVALLHRREAVKAAFLRLGGEVRRVDGEIGDRLVARGLLDDPLSVELLTRPELAAVIDGRPLPPVVLATRRRWFDRQLLGPPLPVRFVGVPEREAVALPPGGRFEGWAASPGRHEGRGVVVRDAAEDLPAGAVLVAVATDPSWSPLFLRAGAIVCERGGPLSHAAILARELGVPAVLNVVGATDHLDGAMLTVDGDAGVVVLHGHDVDETSEDGP